jgi:proline iminopeptidase
LAGGTACPTTANQAVAEWWDRRFRLSNDFSHRNQAASLNAKLNSVPISLFLLLTLSQQTGVVPTAEADLAYELLGSPSPSTPVIAANGGPGLSHIYMVQNDVWTRLSKTRQILFYDQRGTGKSTRLAPNASQEMTAQIADLEAVRAKFGLEKFSLVGDSYGGFLAMAYAAAHPEHIEKLILSDSASPNMKTMVRVLSQVFPDVSTDRGATPDEQMRHHFRMLFYSEENRDAYLAGAKDLGYNPQVGAQVSRSAAKLDLTSALPKFNFPTLVITGRYDMNVAPVNAWNIYKAIPGAKFVVFSKSGHLPSYEEPAKYVEVVDAFLNGR